LPLPLPLRRNDSSISRGPSGAWGIKCILFRMPLFPTMSVMTFIQRIRWMGYDVGFEKWARKDYPYINSLASSPIFPELSFLPSYSGYSAITNLIDTEQYEEVAPSVFFRAASLPALKSDSLNIRMLIILVMIQSLPRITQHGIDIISPILGNPVQIFNCTWTG